MPFWGIIVYVVVMGAVYGFRLLPEARVEAYNDALISLACLFGAYNMWIVSRRFHQTDAVRICWFYFSIGLLLEGVGHVIYSTAEIIYDVALEFPTIADVFIVVGCTFYVRSLYRFLREFNQLSMMPADRRKGIATALALGIIGLVVIFVVYPSLVDDTEPLLLRIALQIYPAIDALLIVFCLHILMGMMAVGYSEVLKPWWILVTAYSLFFLTDSAYGYLIAVDRYHPYALINPGWGLSYLLVSYASYAQWKLMNRFVAFQVSAASILE